jgi:hypothetical protein
VTLPVIMVVSALGPTVKSWQAPGPVNVWSAGPGCAART